MRAFHDDKSIGNVPDSIDKLHVCTSKRLNITIISAIVAVASEDERERESKRVKYACDSIVSGCSMSIIYRLVCYIQQIQINFHVSRLAQREQEDDDDEQDEKTPTFFKYKKCIVGFCSEFHIFEINLNGCK